MLGRPIEGRSDASFERDHEGDHDDHAGDREDHARDHGDDAGDLEDRERDPFRPKPGYQYARNYPDPLTGEPLQVYPSRKPSEFASVDDFLKVIEAVNRWNNGLPPLRPKPSPEQIRSAVPIPGSPGPHMRPSYKSRHVGVRLTERDFDLLVELAHAHAVRVGTMARILIVRGVRAAADG